MSGTVARPDVTDVEIRVHTVAGEEIYRFIRPETVRELLRDDGLIGAIMRGEWVECDGERVAAHGQSGLPDTP